MASTTEKEETAGKEQRRSGGDGSERGVLGKAKDAVAEAPRKVKGAASSAKDSTGRKSGNDAPSATNGGGGGGDEGRSKLRWLALPAALAGAAGAAVYALTKGQGSQGGGDAEAKRNGGPGEDGIVERGKQVVGGAVAQVRDAGGVKEAATDAVSKVREAIGSRESGGGEDEADHESRAGSDTPAVQRDPAEREAARRERQERREERRKRARG
jgi:hypothetical protein